MDTIVHGFDKFCSSLSSLEGTKICVTMASVPLYLHFYSRVHTLCVLGLVISNFLSAFLQRQVDDNGNSLFVSPGPLPERQFYSQVSGATGGSRVQYKLPEYVTSFVLARNIELAFAGLDYETVSDAMNEMSQSSTSVNIFCFHASHSKSQSKSTSNLSVSRSADGMVIKIPGAQIIGYFTEVVPRFPL